MGRDSSAPKSGFVQSNDFVSGGRARGWRISENGDAEFNSVTIRRQIASGSRAAREV